MSKTEKPQKLKILKTCIVSNSRVLITMPVDVNVLSVNDNNITHVSIHYVPMEALKQIAILSGQKLEYLDDSDSYCVNLTSDVTFFADRD